MSDEPSLSSSFSDVVGKQYSPAVVGSSFFPSPQPTRYNVYVTESPAGRPPSTTRTSTSTVDEPPQHFGLVLIFILALGLLLVFLLSRQHNNQLNQHDLIVLTPQQILQRMETDGMTEVMTEINEDDETSRNNNNINSTIHTTATSTYQNNSNRSNEQQPQEEGNLQAVEND